MNCTGVPSVCVSPMCPNIINITSVTPDNFQALVTLIVIDSCFQARIESKS